MLRVCVEDDDHVLHRFTVRSVLPDPRATVRVRSNLQPVLTELRDTPWVYVDILADEAALPRTFAGFVLATFALCVERSVVICMVESKLTKLFPWC